MSILFLLTTSWWGSSYSQLRGPVIGPSSSPAWSSGRIFTLQDSVLVGLRSASWVSSRTASSASPSSSCWWCSSRPPHHLGIYVSWMLPVRVAVPLINMLIFGRLVPSHTP